jgi:hypothetical protein
MFTDKRYSATGILAATNANEYAIDLKKAGYYGDTVDNYARGIERNERGYIGPTTVNNNVVVNAKTNANPQDIASMVKETLADQNAKASRFGNAAGTGVNQ